LLTLVWVAPALRGQEDAPRAGDVVEQGNPHASQADAEAGGAIFRASCALCHGADAKGDLGPDLTRGVFRSGNSDQSLFETIRGGIPNTDMPGTYRPDTEIWQVVTYLRALGKGAARVEIPGDPERGRKIYLSRGSCPDCHRVAGEGGRLGPDLSDLGWSRSPQHISTSIVEPSSTLHPRYRTVVVKTQQGSEVRGVLRNEDSYSVQLLDELENLRSFDKQDVNSVEKPEGSLMPPFEGFFNQRDLQDLVAYLYSLRGNDS
jgi:putative heme-binding domain-containing protein